MKMQRNRWIYAPASALTLAATLIFAAPALAQTPADQSSPAATANNTGGIEEIVVTAQFREQRLQDTPLAITAVNAALMEARSQTNLQQVADTAPNVTIKPQGASFGPSISASIRGIGQADFNPAYEPGVGIYIDDVYYPQLTGAVFDLLDLDRVEILRGPQGTLAGRNSEGGAIKMFSRKPTGSGEGYIEGLYGSRQRIGLRGGVDIRLTDSLSARLSGVYKSQKGFVDQLDFGCVNPVGGTGTFVGNDGATKLINPAGGIPQVQGQGTCRIARLGGVDYKAIRASVRYQPSDAFDLVLTGEYIRDDRTPAGEVLNATQRIDGPNTNQGTNAPQYTGGSPGIPYDNRFICGRFCNYSNYSAPAAVFNGFLTPPGGQPILASSNPNRSVFDAYNLAANAHLDISDTFSIDNILAYQNWKTTFGVDDDLSPIPLSGGFNSLTHYNWSEELRLNAKFGDTITAVAGLYYFKQQTNYFSYQDLRYVPVYPLQFIQPDQTPADSKAAFVNASWEIIPGLTFNGGARYTKESKQYIYSRLNPDGTINRYLDPVGAANGAGSPGALTGLVARYSGSRWDWRAALDYRISPEVMLYASYSTGFKGGGTNPRPFFADQAISFDPEILKNWEAGAKTDFFDRRLRINLTAFYGKLSNAQIGVSVCPPPSTPTPCAALLNAGDAKQKGVEVETTIRPIDGFTIDGSVSYIDFYYTRLSPAVTTTLLSDPRAGLPEWKWTIGGQYEIDLGSGGSLTPRFDAAYQSRTFAGATFTPPGGTRQLISIPGYTVANGRLTWQNEDKDLSASLEVTNLFDKYYFNSLFDLRAAGAGLSKAQPGRPREWALTIKKKF